MTRTLMTLFEELAYDELSTLSVGLPQSGVLTEERERQVVSLVNSGLLNLYSRFPLKEGEVIVEMLPHRTVYPLNSKYARSKENEPDAGDIYIFDSEECPFPDDVLRVLSCQSGHGYPLPLNDSGLPHPDAV